MGQPAGLFMTTAEQGLRTLQQALPHRIIVLGGQRHRPVICPFPGRTSVQDFQPSGRAGTGHAAFRDLSREDIQIGPRVPVHIHQPFVQDAVAAGGQPPVGLIHVRP